MKKFCLFLVCFVSTAISSIRGYADLAPKPGSIRFQQDTASDTTVIVVGAGIAVVIIAVLSILAIKKLNKSKKLDSNAAEENEE